MTHHLGNNEHIALNKLLKLFGLAESGGEANAMITSGEVMVNGETETQKRKKLRVGDEVSFKQTTIRIVS